MYHRLFAASGEREVTRYYNGDGREEKRSVRNYVETSPDVWAWQTEPSEYYIRSTVLGGKVLTEATTNVSKNRTFVFANDEVVAVQKGWIGSTWSPHTRWQYSDPSEASFRTLDASGDVQTDDSAELEPYGSNVGLEPESTGDPYNHVEYGPYGSMGSPTTCLLDGLETNCNLVAQFLNGGVADRCPSDYCGVVRLTNGQNLWGSYLAGYFGQTQGERTSRGQATRARKKTAVRPTLKKRASPRRTPEQRRIQRAIETSGVFDNETENLPELYDPSERIQIGIVQKIFAAGDFVDWHTRFVGFNAEEESALRTRLMIAVMYKPCVDSYKNFPGIKATPAEVLRDRGLTVINAKSLTDASVDSEFAKPGQREEMLEHFSGYFGFVFGASGATFFPNSYTENPTIRIVIGLNFGSVTSDIDEDMFHEIVHGGGVPGQRPISGGLLSPVHDLSNFGKYYEQIKENCNIFKLLKK
ncbi:MAG: hypothetical protein K1X36_09900 [Pyrinomonadaceae bacterium]|nr:hypothetical protein [Pyrinomonadaceae bacterium]